MSDKLKINGDKSKNDKLKDDKVKKSIKNKLFADFAIETLSKIMEYNDEEVEQYFIEFKSVIKMAAKIAISFMNNIGESGWKNFDPKAGEMILPPVREGYLNGNFSENVIVKCRRNNEGYSNYAGLGNEDGTYEIIGYMNILDEVWFDPSIEEVINDDVIAWKRYK